MEKNCKIAFGGGCHWCTEAVYQSLKGVLVVEQGFVASEGKDASFSEAVIVHYDANTIGMKELILIHLNTHNSSSNHSMREKYRSAIYTFNATDAKKAKEWLQTFRPVFKDKLITKVLPFREFRGSDKMFRDYYYNNPKKDTIPLTV